MRLSTLFGLFVLALVLGFAPTEADASPRRGRVVVRQQRAVVVRQRAVRRAAVVVRAPRATVVVRTRR
ncbi:MAG TPA: hypothetical protein VD932_02575 [Aquabacterium sp.]|nr:hypothetical protein [Aquabacterium sp.]